MTRAHWIHIEQKPRAGSGFIRQYRAYQYQHTKMAMGGDDAASYTVLATVAEAERILSEYVGNAVSVYVDNPACPVFEGYVNRVTFEVGGVVFTRSLDAMNNRVKITYWNKDSAAANKTEATAYAGNTASQALYGRKDGNFDAGVHYDNADKSHKTVLRDKLLNVGAYPSVSTEFRPGGAVSVKFQVLGFYHMWDWEIYNNTGTTTRGAGIMMRRLLTWTDADAPANAPFIYETRLVAGGATPLMSANTAFNIAETSQTGQTYWQFAQSIAEAGDGVKPWVCGITRRDINTGLRQAYYRASNLTTRYHLRPLTEPGVIRDVVGRRVNLWDVEADCQVRVNDALIGYDAKGDNPALMYVSAVDYDAESQTVTLQSSDDITLQGALRFRQYYKRHGDRLGATVRPLY